MAVNITCKIQLCSLVGSRRKSGRGNKVREQRGIGKWTRAHANHRGARQLRESQRAYRIYFLKKNQTTQPRLPNPLTSESSLSFQTPPGETPVASAESDTSHMPKTSHGGIGVADHQADHDEQGECAAVGEL